MSEFDFDCLVVGGGPAGLTAAIYLARYHLSSRVVDAGNSRASWIPCTHNHAGYPEGISGSDLLDRMRKQAQLYGATIKTGRVTRLEQLDGGFFAEWGSGSASARKVLLATGLTNRRPPMDERLHDAAVSAGLLRYCPVCDGYEVTDKKVAIIGSGSHGVAEAVFLRGFTEDVTLIAPDRAHELDDINDSTMKELGVKRIDGPCDDVFPDNGCITIATPCGNHTFDSAYPALGSDVHSELAKQVGAAIAEDGTLTVDCHQRTSVFGLYAAGDVVLGLDQISHAMGEGGVAATTIRNDIAADKPILRERLRGNSMK